MLQKSLEEIEVKLAVYRSLRAQEIEHLRACVVRDLGYDLLVRFSFAEAIPEEVGGKFENFIFEIIDRK